jgi:hypothetical protein
MDDGTQLSRSEEDAALERIEAGFFERSRLIAINTGKSFVKFIASAAIASLFVKGMPLHRLFVPWGQVLLVVCAVLFAVALYGLAILIGDMLDRRWLNKQRQLW